SPRGSTPASPTETKGGGDDDPERARAPYIGPEPELATGPRHDRGASSRHALERDGEGRRAGGVPALRLGRLVRARASERQPMRAVGPPELPGSRGHLPCALRPPAGVGGDVQSAEC